MAKEVEQGQRMVFVLDHQVKGRVRPQKRDALPGVKLLYLAPLLPHLLVHVAEAF